MKRLVPGFFGKLPAKGDFVERRLSKTLITHWDGWLQRCILSSREKLGPRWLDHYLTAPLWAFASSAQVLGDNPCLGVVMPSVDKVGRYFPLLVAVELEPGDDAVALLRTNGQWLQRVEEALLSTLDESSNSLEPFDEAIAGLDLSLSDDPTLQYPQDPARTLDDAPHLAFPFASSSAQIEEALGPHLSDPGFGPFSVWTTAGSEHVSPSTALCAGLPDTELFSALLDGRWAEHGWSVQAFEDLGTENLQTEQPSAEIGLLGDPVDSTVEWFAAPPESPPQGAASVAVAAELSVPAAAFLLRSASVSHTGNVREGNQDACISRDDLSVWMVADGVGGHGAGELASALAVMVVDELPQGSLQTRLDALLMGLRLTQKTLQLVGDRYGETARSATTVVTLMVDADQAVVSWVGDSRLYQLREGSMTQLMQDHSDDFGGGDSNVITRAVGGDEPLELEQRCYQIQAGDRFLLCSDGVYRELSPDRLTALLTATSAEEACQQIKEQVLQGPAQDNFTAIVVDCVAFEDALIAL